MNQASIDKLIPALRFVIPTKRRNFNIPDGLHGRLLKLRKTVTALFKYERIELNYHRADESRQYAERLIQEAIIHGDRHIKTMEMADFWLEEKQLIHKLFKVLVPRYESYNSSYTRLLKAPTYSPEMEQKALDFKMNTNRDVQKYPSHINPMRALLELKGNPYPPLFVGQKPNNKSISNILLEEVRKENALPKPS